MDGFADDGSGGGGGGASRRSNWIQQFASAVLPEGGSVGAIRTSSEENGFEKARIWLRGWASVEKTAKRTAAAKRPTRRWPVRMLFGIKGRRLSVGHTRAATFYLLDPRNRSRVTVMW